MNMKNKKGKQNNGKMTHKKGKNIFLLYEKPVANFLHLQIQ